MANIHMLAAPASDDGTASGGDWLDNLPLAHLKTQQPTEVARSDGLSPTATRFVIDLGIIRPVSMLAMIANNLTNDAVVRYRCSVNADGSAPALDVTVPAYVPNVPWGSLPWGDFPWTGFIDDPQPGGAITFYRQAKSAFGRYVLVDIDDQSNPDGYVQIGRFMAGTAFVPRINMSWGTQLSPLDDSTSSTSVGGQKWWDRRSKRRRVTVAFDALAKGEAMGAIYDMQHKLGLTGNLLVVYDPEDSTDTLLRRTIYGSFAGLEPIIDANATIAPYTWSMTVEELI